jgi:predicted nucleic acid-binding protein
LIRPSLSITWRVTKTRPSTGSSRSSTGISRSAFAEVLQGAATAKDFETLQGYLSSQTIYDLVGGLDSYIAASRLYFDLRKKGLSVSSSVDCLIAQTAIEHDLFILHNDSDFERIARVSSLKIY